MVHRTTNQSGQSLLEITITVGISAMIITALVMTTLLGLRNSQLAQNQTQATKLAQEGLERVRAIRNNDNNANGMTTTIGPTAGVYHWYGTTNPVWVIDIFGNVNNPGNICKVTNCQWFFSSACQSAPANCTLITSIVGRETLNVNNFTRSVLIEDVDQPSKNPNQKRVSSIVTWNDASGTHQSQLSTYLTNY